MSARARLPRCSCGSWTAPGCTSSRSRRMASSRCRAWTTAAAWGSSALFRPRRETRSTQTSPLRRSRLRTSRRSLDSRIPRNRFSSTRKRSSTNARRLPRRRTRRPGAVPSRSRRARQRRGSRRQGVRRARCHATSRRASARSGDAAASHRLSYGRQFLGEGSGDARARGGSGDGRERAVSARQTAILLTRRTLKKIMKTAKTPSARTCGASSTRPASRSTIPRMTATM